MLTHIDLFSGIGGFALAAQWAGFRTVQFVEKDRFCQSIIHKHWPEVPIHGDIKSFSWVGGYAPTLLTGGFPCQPFSLAGKRHGAADDRYLWPEMLRVISEVRPAWVVGENVIGITSMELERVCSDLESEGYGVWPTVIPACGVGAIHERARVWIIANIGEPGLQEFISSGEKHKGGPGPYWVHLRRERHPGDTAEAFIRRGDDGIPNRVDRIKALGNAIVPQVAFEIIRGITEIETRQG